MIANNIWRLIGNFFEWCYSISYDIFRLGDFNWWTANTVNWIFLVVLLVLFAYWMKESARFKREGKEDKA